MDILIVVLLIGATIRLTRLVTTDVILERPRAWIERRLNDKLRYLIRCPWCASWWIGLAVFAFGWYGPDAAAWIVAGALTASLFAAWAAEVENLFDIIVDLLAPEPEPEPEPEPVITGRSYDREYAYPFWSDAQHAQCEPRLPERSGP